MSTPTERMVAALSQPSEIRDELGRILMVRRLTALDRLRLFKALGAALAENPPYLGMAVIAASVTEIDGVPVPPPVTEFQVEGLVQRLGDAGMEAVVALLERDSPSRMSETEAGN
jgi:hypothetical protein